MNSIIVSFDQKQAVRIRDGLKLKAVPRPEGSPSTGRTRCDGCEVPQTGTRGCFINYGVHGRCHTNQPRFCMAADRKDGRNVTWRTYDL